MDQLTQLYKSRAEDLQRKVFVLEEKLKYLVEEDEKPSTVNVADLVKSGWTQVPIIVNGRMVARELTSPDGKQKIKLHSQNDEILPPEPPEPPKSDGDGETPTEPSMIDAVLDYQVPGAQYLNIIGAPTSIRQSFKEHPYATTLGLLATTEVPFARMSPTSRYKWLDYFTSYKQPSSLRPMSGAGEASKILVPEVGSLQAKPFFSPYSLNPVTGTSRAIANLNMAMLGRKGQEALNRAEEARQAAEYVKQMKEIAKQTEDAVRAAEQIPPGDPRRVAALVAREGEAPPKTALTDVGREGAEAGKDYVESKVRAASGGSINDEVRKLIRTSDSLRTSAETLPPESSPVGRVSGRGASAVAALEPPQMPKTPQEWVDAFKRGVQPDIEAAKMTGRDVGRVAGTLGRGALKTALTLGQATPEGAATTIASDIASGLGLGAEFASGIAMLPLAYLAYEQQAGGPDIDYSAGAKEVERKYLERKAIRAMNPVTGVIDALQDIANQKREAEQLRQYEEEEKKKQKESSGMMDAMAKGMASYHP